MVISTTTATYASFSPDQLNIPVSVLVRLLSVHTEAYARTSLILLEFCCLFVTVYGKTRHMGFFVKIEFDVSLISSTLELTHLQV